MFVTDGLLNQLTASTRRFVRDNPKLVDNVFQQGTGMRILQKACKEPFTGGRIIADNFWYGVLPGGPSSMGQEFNITEPQVEQQKQFIPKEMYVNITLLKEEIQVFNTGPEQIFSLLKSRTENAYAAIGAFMELGLYLNGINANYTTNFNGLPEMLNDGSTASWDGNTYANYGGIARSAVGAALNSVPVNVNGTIELAGTNGLEQTYMAASYGPELQPNYGITTQIAYSLIKNRFQTQQRFNDTQDPKIGFNALKFNNAMLVWSRYVPGSYLFGGTVAGTADPVAVQFVKQMSGGALTAYPVPSGYTSGNSETLWWVNATKPYINYYLSTNPEFGLGTTGYKPAQGNTKVACQVLMIGAVTGEPRYHKQLYGITG